MADLFSFPQEDIPGLLTPNRQAVLGAAAGLLNASGYQQTPPTLGSVLGGGLATGLSSYNSAIKSAAELAKARNHELPSDLQEYEYAVKQGYQGNYTDFIALKRAGAGEFGLQPLYGRDAQGNVVPIQLGKTGNAIASKLPPGLQIQGKDTMKIDAGDHWILMDPLTRQPIGSVPKNEQELARQKEFGREQAQAQLALPSAEATAQRTLQHIDELLAHPGRDASVGMILGRLPAIGGKQADYVERFNQLIGDAFLDAYATLRGGGAITEAEGLKATVSRFRSGRIKTAEDIQKAIEDFRSNVIRGLEVVRRKAEGTVGKTQPPATQPAPQPAPQSSGYIPVGPNGERIMWPDNVPPPPPGATPIP